MSILLCVGCNVESTQHKCSTETIAPVVIEQVKKDTAPPCIHEVCAERPSHLTCDSRGVYNSCDVWRVRYEHHCTCDQWGIK